MSGPTTISYYDRNNQPREALAGSDVAGNTVSGHTAFDINGLPVEVATKQGQDSLGLKLDTANVSLVAIKEDADAVMLGVGAKSDAPATLGTDASMIALLKAVFAKLGGVVLAAGTAIIGRVILSDQAGNPYTGTNRLVTSNPSIEPSSDSFPIDVSSASADFTATFPAGIILRASGAGTIDVTTLSGNRRTMAFLAGETRSVRVLKVWTGASTTATGIEGMP